MIRIRIGDSERELDAADPHWINQQINRRRQAGETVCVVVKVNQGGLNITLTTPTCGGGTGGRNPTPDEQRIFDLWRERGLRENDFTGGNLVAFIKQLKSLLGL